MKIHTKSVLVGLLVVGFLAGGIAAAADLVLSDESGNIGQTVTSILTINNVGGLAVESLDIELTYDPGVVTFVTGRNGTGLDGGPFAPTTPVMNDLGGTILIAGTTLLVGVIPPEGGVLFELDFQIRGDAVLDTVTMQDLVEIRINESTIFTSLGGTPNATPGSITVASPPPVYQMTAARVDPVATDMLIDWNGSACPGGSDHQIVWGFGSQLPTVSGGTFVVGGSVCSIGPGPPYTWTSSPDPSVDPSGLLWWLVLATDAATEEGPWRLDGAGAERVGPGAGGSSGQCGIAVKNLATTCPAP